MPLIFVQRYVVEEALLEGGTQFVDGTLRFTGPTTIYLSNSVFSETGRYVLFEYTTFDYTGYASEQAALDALVTVNADDLTLSELPALSVDVANNRIILSLKSKTSNGTQFVDGDLAIADGSSLYLSASLYATAGTYVLFDVTGTITATLSGGSPNYLTGLNVYALKSGRSVVGNRAFKDNNQIKVTLV